MYLYLYAPYLRGRKHARDLALIEGRVTDFGISGKVYQLSQFLKFPAAVKEFGLKRLKTLVLVGDDALLDESVSHFAGSETVLAYIPIGESKYARALGIPQGASAADVLAARRIARLNLGRVGERFFLGSISCEGRGLEVHTPMFSIFPKEYAKVEVINLEEGALPVSGALRVRVTPFQGSRWRRIPDTPSVMEVTSCRIKAARALLVQVGAGSILKTPLQVDIVQRAVRMVMGRSVKMEKVKSKR